MLGDFFIIIIIFSFFKVEGGNIACSRIKPTIFKDLVVCCRILGELLLLILAITFTATMSSLLAIIKVVIMVIGDNNDRW